ncbi:hypothetical protein FNV43_RR05056 [Rhamnella rubrinervis]|uniref:RING-type domain-containing protein n=1 Tax=Rhamnella rubrinervis TaxID=2594499 RepID=A0A8K0HM88_9ROSA|nr:hypothetical protein FNV43_RR05056 [Rhamnella rubrinervis]
MGFDNECILNIQSLAGEYFCPVCRLLVYPNEALQSQCTHLYCKPCLTYVVSTTRACPYDGYLVTEADSKPLNESNKSLAETIGKIAVHCLYHRSGCTWQGPLSECTSHCSGCAFGDSPVVCNRCGIQIVHRQVQEHAQNCPGVQLQTQQAEGAAGTSSISTTSTVDQTQATTQAAAVTSQSQTSQNTVTTMPGQDPNQQANSSSQAQAVVQSAVPTADQWYQQQQQYQQYYQQYPGYDPYQQHFPNYYPYQQAAVPQYQQPHLQAHGQQATGQNQSQVYIQPQSQSQPQLQPQPRPQPQAPNVQVSVATQPQNLAPVNQQQQALPAVPHIPKSNHKLIHQLMVSESSTSTIHSSSASSAWANSTISAASSSNATSPATNSATDPMQVQPHHPPSQAHPQGQIQQHSQFHPPQPNHPLNANIQPQAQNPSAHAVTGHHSYPQAHPHQQVQAGVAQQYPVHAHPQAVPPLQSQNPAQMQSHFPQQPPLMRPPHSHATIPSQQQPALLPSPGQVQNITPSKQQSAHTHLQQPGHPVQQRPIMQPAQQPMPQQYYQQQQPFQQHQLPMTSQLHHQGQSHPFPQHTHSFPQPPLNVALSHGLQYTQTQNLVGRPLMPNHGVQPQPYPQSAGAVQARPVYLGANQQSTNHNNMHKTIQLPSEQHASGNSRPTMSENQGDTIFEKGLPLQEAELLPQKTVKVVANELGSAPGLVADVSEAYTSLKKIPQSTEIGIDPESHFSENGEPTTKLIMKEVNEESTQERSSSKQMERYDPENEIMDGSHMKNLSPQVSKLHEEQGGKLQKDAISGSDEGLQAVCTASAAIVGSIPQNVTSGETAPGNEKMQLNQHDFQDKTLPQVPGSSTLPQRPGAPSLLQAPPPGPPHQPQGLGHPPAHFRPQGPGHVPGQPFHLPGGVQDAGSTATFGRGPGQYGPSQRSFNLQSGAPVGPYNQGHAAVLPFGAPPPRAFDSRGGMLPRPPLSQPSGIDPNMMKMNGTPGFDSSLALGSRNERFKPFLDEQLNPVPPGTDLHVFDRAEFEDDLKKFSKPSLLDAEPIQKFGNLSSRPYDRGPHGVKYDAGLKLEPGTGSSRFLSPYHGGGALQANEVGEDIIGRIESTRHHPDFFGPFPAYGRHHMDGMPMPPRSPPREHHGISSHGFGGSAYDDFDGREFHRFGEPVDSRFSMLPSHLRRGEFEGPGNLRMGEHLRNDLVGQDSLPGHLRRGEHFGPRNLHGSLHLGEPVGFGVHPRHVQMGGMAGPGSFESFGGSNRPTYPRFGEPGFRSSFSLQGFSNDGGTYTGDMEFQNLRKRKPASSGWEHQKLAMDMVLSIKQNAKRQKLTSSDRSSLGDASKSRNAGLEGRGKKN